MTRGKKDWTSARTGTFQTELPGVVKLMLVLRIQERIGNAANVWVRWANVTFRSPLTSFTTDRGEAVVQTCVLREADLGTLGKR